MLYIGATINLNGFEYHITDADEFTLKYMESHPSEYPMANISSIMSKIKDAIKPQYKDFIGKYLDVAVLTESATKLDRLTICYDTTAIALRELLGSAITEHEIVTFLRYFSAGRACATQPTLNRTTVQALVQMSLTNHLWNDMQSLKEFIYDFDPMNHNGYMSPGKIRTIIKGCRLPIKEVLIDDMFCV